MLALSSLLNPIPSDSLPRSQPLPSPTVSSPATSCADVTASPASSRLERSLLSKHKMSRDSLPLSKSKPRGVINYPPHEDLDDNSLREVQKFQVTPFGQIRHCCAHIPYNSGKKDFFVKTGRESFEVFKYDFRVPGNDTDYTIMWDYNVGLVRMTPFFKCCKYGKTVPAKMLSLNPGLKDITHSITGGAILAQGYWMPFFCARAVCATFCYEIAGALIPIFGPSFPSQCTPPGAPDFQRMIINPRVVFEAMRDAEVSRFDQHRHQAHKHHQHQHQHHHDNQDTSSIGYGGYYSSPDRSDRRPPRTLRNPNGCLRLDTRMLSPYSTEPDLDGHHSGPDSASSSGSGSGYYPIPVPGRRHIRPGWTAANHQQHRPSPPRSTYHGDDHQPPNPFLSAVPRLGSPSIHHQHHRHHHEQQQQQQEQHPYPRNMTPPRSQPTPPGQIWSTKRTFNDGESNGCSGQPRPLIPDVDFDPGYEAGESQNGSPALEYIASKRRETQEKERQVPAEDLAQQKAALLLMNLSVAGGGGEVEAAPAQMPLEHEKRGNEVVSDVDDGDVAHRRKRRRAASM